MPPSALRSRCAMSSLRDIDEALQVRPVLRLLTSSVQSPSRQLSYGSSSAVADAPQMERELAARGVTISDAVQRYEDHPYWVGAFLDSEGNKLWFCSRGRAAHPQRARQPGAVPGKPRVPGVRGVGRVVAEDGPASRRSACGAAGTGRPDPVCAGVRIGGPRYQDQPLRNRSLSGVLSSVSLSAPRNEIVCPGYSAAWARAEGIDRAD